MVLKPPKLTMKSLAPLVKLRGLLREMPEEEGDPLWLCFEPALEVPEPPSPEEAPVDEDPLAETEAEAPVEEPVLVADRTAAELDALRSIYQRLTAVKGQSKLLVQTYFGDPGESLGVLADLPIDGVGLDLVRGAGAVERIVRDGLDGSAVIFAGVVDGRNVWTNDLRSSLAVLQRLVERSSDAISLELGGQQRVERDGHDGDRDFQGALPSFLASTCSYFSVPWIFGF